MPKSNARARASVDASQSDSAFDLLREQIIAGRFEPGAKLRIEQLCAQYDVGASPMREALSRLAETNLVVFEPQRGYWVAPISIEEYRDLVGMRVRLESQALAESIHNGDLEWEAQVVAAFHRLSHAHKQLSTGTDEAFANWVREDRAFHMTTLSRCKSKWLLHFCRLIQDQLARYHRAQHLTGIDPGAVNQQEHARLLDAVLSRDVDFAVKTFTNHVSSVAQRVAPGTAARGRERPARTRRRA